MNGAGRPGAGGVAGLFLVTLATLMLQLLLTRIFSVTMWYHYAFFVIAMAMFGMTAGALAVHLRPATFTNDRLGRHVSGATLLFALSIVLGFFGSLLVARLSADARGFLPTALSLGATFLLVSVPFFLSGIVVCLMLTRFPERLGLLYGADLLGAALGCVALIGLLEITDGPTAVVAVAAVAALAACFFARSHGERMLWRRSLAAVLLLGAVAAGNTWLVRADGSLFSIGSIVTKRRNPVIREVWNSHSYLRVDGYLDRFSRPFGWGLSEAYPEDRLVRQLGIAIDAGAATVVTSYEGDPRTLDYLAWDITNLPHHVLADADTLVVGAGGGRDVLSALLFEQASVTAVEFNEDLLELVNGTFGEFSGHLDRHPRVRFVNDEARSYLERTDRRWDIIQVSMVDTWAATAAGAFVLTEHSLYTREAFDLFLRRLTPGGLLSFTRWYVLENPAEMYRLTALGADALVRSGARDPRRHLYIARTNPSGPGAVAAVSTFLLSPRPLTEWQLDRLGRIAEEMRFVPVLTPREAADPVLERIASGRDLEAFTRAFPSDIAPPTDDRPFFFYTLRLGTLLRGGAAGLVLDDVNVRAVAMLGGALAVVCLFTLLCLVVPLLLARGRPGASSGGGSPFLIFFIAIGLGFMLVEMSLVQRLTLFLGHPTYGLSVALTSLLAASGAGSLLAQRVIGGAGAGRRTAILLAIPAALLLFGLLTPAAVAAWRGAATPVRIGVAMAALVPPGLLMGMAFPLGMSLAARRVPGLTAWLWGLNGAASVTASVLGVVIALKAGISAEFWAGTACYLVALACFVLMGRPSSRR